MNKLYFTLTVLKLENVRLIYILAYSTLAHSELCCTHYCCNTIADKELRI